MEGWFLPAPGGGGEALLPREKVLGAKASCQVTAGSLGNACVLLLQMKAIIAMVVVILLLVIIGESHHPCHVWQGHFGGTPCCG